MAKKPPPERQKYAARLRSMKMASYLFLKDAVPTSVRTVCARLSAQTKRQYRTAKCNGGVDVWRVK